MKKLILNLFFMSVLSILSISAGSCDNNICMPKRSSKKNYSKKCETKVNHTNRKIKSCKKNDDCAKKNVRLNKLAKRKCSNE